MKLAKPGKRGFNGSRPAAIGRFVAERYLGHGRLRIATHMSTAHAAEGAIRAFAPLHEPCSQSLATRPYSF
jgi:hypothetical protein